MHCRLCPGTLRKNGAIVKAATNRSNGKRHREQVKLFLLHYLHLHLHLVDALL